MRIQEMLFEPTLVRSPLRVLGWWERRRLAYNVAVGVVGVGTLAWVTLLNWLVFGGHAGPPPLVVVAYAVAANVCYSFGTVVELVVERWLGRPVYGLGPALFRHGLVFSIGLTLLPALIGSVGAIGALLFR